MIKKGDGLCEEKRRAFISDTEEQQKGLSAAMTALLYQDEKDFIAKEVGESAATVDK